MKVKLVLTWLGIIMVSICFLSCSDDDGGGSGTNEFDRKAMLENIGFNLIIPEYQQLQSAVNELNTATEAFTQSPDIANLSILRNAFTTSYLQWQNVSMYEFAEAETVLLRGSLNSFPTNTIVINSNLQSGSYNLDAISNINAVGFPALDFLLFGDSKTDSEILTDFNVAENFENRRQYIKDIVAQIKVKTDQVVNSWLGSEGNYIQTFINADATDIGSSLGLLVNALNLHVEKFLRDNKIGIPLGTRSLGIPVPANVEARYSQNSINLAVANLKAIKNLYLGDNDTNGLGIYENLVDLGATVDGAQLADKILNQFDEVIQKVEAIPEPYATTVESNPNSATEAHSAIQQLVVLLKTDMPSALGVLITYQDNDGD